MPNEQTIGEQRVRTSFNPDSPIEGLNEKVEEIKQKSAEIINLIDAVFGEPGAPSPDANRLRALAMTSIEEGCMWAVKAATS